VRELYPALLLGLPPVWRCRRFLKHPPYGGVCILLRLTVASISYVDIEKSLKKRRSANFQEDALPGVRLSCRPHGYYLLRCPCRCPRPLIRYVAFATVTMWAGLPEPRDCGVLSIVLCVLRGLEPSLSLFLAISSQVRQRPHYYLSRCCLGSYPRLSDCLHAHLLDGAFRLLLHLCYDWSLCLAQLTPAYGVTSFRLIRAATALLRQRSVALLPLLAMGTHQSLLLTVFFLLRSLNRCFSMS
jgi:hypothetical protein